MASDTWDDYAARQTGRRILPDRYRCTCCSNGRFLLCSVLKGSVSEVIGHLEKDGDSA
jgi:hypothetical protein